LHVLEDWDEGIARGVGITSQDQFDVGRYHGIALSSGVGAKRSPWPAGSSQMMGKTEEAPHSQGLQRNRAREEQPACQWREAAFNASLVDFIRSVQGR
jgi:hypothetical protein